MAVDWRGAKLHLGCGAKRLEGWVNSDGQERPVVEGAAGRPDVVLDVYRNLTAIPEGSLARIYWSHGPEHIHPDRLVGVLANLRRALRLGGVLTLATTDIVGVYENRYRTRRDGPYWVEAIFGETASTDHPFASHKLIFDDALLRDYLAQAGFDPARIRPWEPEQYPEIAAMNDYAVRARLVSLLLEAVK